MVANDQGQRVRRSLLITPAHREDLIAKLAKSPADVCVVELEDGVHDDMKAEAREAAARQLQDLDWGPRERLVRINRVTTKLGEDDIAAVVAGRPDSLLLPKVEHEEEILAADEMITAAEKEHGVPAGSVGIWSMIESASGLCRVEAICEANARMNGLLFGGGDLGANLQVKRIGLGSFRRTPGPAHEYLYGRGRVVAAARAFGIDPIDVGHSTITDLEGTRRTAEFSAQMGFSGSIVFSPRQVPVINEVFSPAEEDLAWATEVVEAFEAARQEQGTVAVVDGEMIDGPFVLNARDILSRQTAMKAFDATK